MASAKAKEKDGSGVLSSVLSPNSVLTKLFKSSRPMSPQAALELPLDNRASSLQRISVVIAQTKQRTTAQWLSSLPIQIAARLPRACSTTVKARVDNCSTRAGLRSCCSWWSGNKEYVSAFKAERLSRSSATVIRSPSRVDLRTSLPGSL
jgi:hypothetical protein